MVTKIAVLAMTAVLFLHGCFGEEAPPPDEKVDGVVRILMHEPGHYTVLLQKSAASTITERQLTVGCGGKVTYVPDVASSQPMWLLIHFEKTEGCLGMNESITFHIHEEGDIGGAGWSHHTRPRRSGQTSVIQ